MKMTLKILKALSDETRLRMLMLLRKQELSVCQIMGVLCISQPLVSRNLYILTEAGFLAERRQGKFIFYCLKKDLPKTLKEIINLIYESIKDDTVIKDDAMALKECKEFQKKAGRCDMETYKAFMESLKKKRAIKKRGIR